MPRKQVDLMARYTSNPSKRWGKALTKITFVEGFLCFRAEGSE